MAAQIPDPRTLQSWDDAFAYPLPVVRKLEQQLRKNIDENRERLRVLVGASYRDLMGTAERIIAMDEQMTAVETQLGGLGRKCRAPPVGERRVVAAAGEDRKERRMGAMAQMKVLQGAVAAARRGIRKGGDALGVAKVLVLARLVGKSLAEKEEEEEEEEGQGRRSKVLEGLLREVGSLRRKLLGYIERALVRRGSEGEGLANTLCAYALVSSSAPKDVLRHFLQTRVQQIEAETDLPNERDVMQMLELYEQTLLDTRTLFPKLFVDALSQLTQIPLLDDRQVREIHALNLDVYGEWIVDSVRTFTPWVRHDQLLNSDVGDALASWSTHAQQCIIGAIRKCVTEQSDASSVLDVRRKVVMHYLRLSSNTRDGEYSQIIKNVRAIFVERLTHLATLAAASLQSQLDTTDAITSAHGVPYSLWDLASDDIDLGHGAKRFRHDVSSRRQGRDSSVEQYAKGLDLWTGEVDSIHQLFQQMRSARWDDELDVDFEEVADGEAIRNSLSKQDPETLQNALHKAVGQALQQIYEHIRQRCDSKAQPARLVRLLRELQQRRRAIEEHYAVATEVAAFSQLVQTLHSRVAQEVAASAVNQYAAGSRKKTRTAASLWDGSPPLPVQPSPATYRFLVSLHKAMSASGIDLWSPDAVNILKHDLDDRLADALTTSTSEAGSDESLSNGHFAPEKANEESAEKNPGTNGETASFSRAELLQRLFDALYLQRVMSTPSTGPSDGLGRQVTKLREDTEVEDASYERLRKNANEYWKRTYLLFGLLSPSEGV